MTDSDHILCKFFDHRLQSQWKLTDTQMCDLFAVNQDRLKTLREQEFHVLQDTPRSRIIMEPEALWKMIDRNCPDDSEKTHARMAEVFWIRSELFYTFGDHDREHRWLSQPHSDLRPGFLRRKRSPMELILSGDFDDLNRAREFVQYACNGPYG